MRHFRGFSAIDHVEIYKVSFLIYPPYFLSFASAFGSAVWVLTFALRALYSVWYSVSAWRKIEGLPFRHFIFFFVFFTAFPGVENR